jgi:hypothetical protein
MPGNTYDLFATCIGGHILLGLLVVGLFARALEGGKTVDQKFRFYNQKKGGALYYRLHARLFISFVC